ncbi:hypothetical protein AF335_04115 [Streptomyces eurocidicus]|uniref:Uncharacterized protein n=1 Tax=Streptomyces eurocidicus TaxID=66423 RepID=A0A2N8P3B4_STREU|nr:hypothetical protein [Streptomyces eurocidicus]MBB5117709.1 hypothetical protein [Streptomyces eurocidicus]MBF6053544.1 hypothetical protein [Streptomyces eurocidicus]PNE35505.1 hypothetical protein AF335_04115 [Streptomyces eurocidicus]
MTWNSPFRVAAALLAAVAATTALVPGTAAAETTRDRPLPTWTFRLQLGAGTSGSNKCLTATDNGPAFRKCGDEQYAPQQRWTSDGAGHGKLISLYRQGQPTTVPSCLGAGGLIYQSPAAFRPCDGAAAPVWSWNPGKHRIHFSYVDDGKLRTGSLTAGRGTKSRPHIDKKTTNMNDLYRTWSFIPVQ